MRPDVIVIARVLLQTLAQIHLAKTMMCDSPETVLAFGHLSHFAEMQPVREPVATLDAMDMEHPMASHRHASRQPPARRLAARAMGERHNPLLTLINRNDGLTRCPIQSDCHDHLDPMTVMAALPVAKVKPQYSADQEYRDVNESLLIGRAGPGLPGDVLVRGSAEGQNEDSSGTRNSHNMRIHRRGRIAARGQKLQSNANLHEIRRPKLGTYQGLLLRLQRI